MLPAAFTFVWSTLHVLAFSYPENPSAEKKLSMLKFLEGIMANLPCPSCSVHALKYITENTPNVSCRENLKAYLYDFHNAVNKRLGKLELSHAECDKAVLEKHFKQQDWVELSRAQEIRREDHAKMIALKESCATEAIKYSAYGLTGGLVVGIIATLAVVWFFRRLNEKATRTKSKSETKSSQK
jgi:hypothetical protein